MDKARVLAVVDMPSEAFQPSTSTKTSILFLQKKKEGERISNYPVFMAVGEKCGHDRRGKPIREDDFPKITENYNKFRKENNISF